MPTRCCSLMSMRRPSASTATVSAVHASSAALIFAMTTCRVRLVSSITSIATAIRRSAGVGWGFIPHRSFLPQRASEGWPSAATALRQSGRSGTVTRHPRRRQILGLRTLVPLALCGVIAAGCGGGGSGASIPAGYTNGIGGSLAGDGGVTGSDVWCAWRGGHVWVHATLTNGSVASVNVQVTPSYDVEDGGTHGDSVAGSLSLPTPDISGGGSVDWLGDAGAPTGIPAGATLSACHPDVVDGVTQIG